MRGRVYQQNRPDFVLHDDLTNAITAESLAVMGSGVPCGASDVGSCASSLKDARFPTLPRTRIFRRTNTVSKQGAVADREQNTEPSHHRHRPDVILCSKRPAIASRVHAQRLLRQSVTALRSICL